MYKAIKTLEEMPGALSYLIEKVEGLEKAAQSLLNRQEESSSPHWMDVDELCDYIPSHPVKQTVYGWVSDCGNKSIEKQRQNSQESRTI